MLGRDGDTCIWCGRTLDGLVPATVTKSGYTNGAIPRVYGKQASEYVINRAMS